MAKKYDPVKNLKFDDTKKAMQFIVDSVDVDNERGYSPGLKGVEVLLRELEELRKSKFEYKPVSAVIKGGATFKGHERESFGGPYDI